MYDYDKNKQSSYLKHWGINNLYAWTMRQKFSVNGFKSFDYLSEFDESFINSYN